MTSDADRASLAGSEPPRRGQAVAVGPADLGQSLSVSMYLRPKEPIEGGGGRREDESVALSREEYAERFGAADDDIARVKQFAEEYGLEVTDVDRGARRVRLRGTVAQLGKAFGVKLVEYRDGATGYLSHERPVSVPAQLAPSVQAVLGLDTHPAARRAGT
jgi:kumamolisin